MRKGLGDQASEKRKHSCSSLISFFNADCFQ
jgi:hypothetical protein